MKQMRPRVGGAAIVALALIAASCGGDDDASDQDAAEVTAEDTASEPSADVTAEESTTAEAGGEPTGDPVVFGGLFDETGPFSILGADEVIGARAAVEWLNANGGVLGRPVELRAIDAESDPNIATQAMNELISDDVVGIVGPDIAPIALPVIPIAVQSEVPILVTSGAFYAAVEDDQVPYVFGIGGESPQAIPRFVDYWVDQGYKSVAVIGQDAPLYRGVSARIDELATAAGIEVVASESYGADVTEFTPILAQIREKAPDVLWIASSGPTFVTIMQNARDLGWTGEIDSHVGNVSTQTFELVGPDLLTGVVILGFKGMDLESVEDDVQRQAIVDYEEGLAAIGADLGPASLAAIGWDSVLLLANAVEQAGTTDRAAVRDALEASTFTGAQDTYTFPPDNHLGPNDPWIILEITGPNAFRAVG